MVFDLEAEIESRREIVDKYTKELEELEKEQNQRKQDIEDNQEKFEDVEKTIAVSGGDKARELQEDLDKARVAHALAERNSDAAHKDLQELEKARKLLSQDHKITSNELKELMGELEKSSKEVKKLESEVTACF